MKGMKQGLVTIDSFSPSAKKLREHFERRFADPKTVRGDRFVWDYWHVPGQYTALRTPAYHFFPPKLYQAFHRQLVLWGRENLGCHDVSPPWLSCYVDGCGQEFHGDLPHGPWAYVFSLTPWKQRKFRGGETVLLKEEILSYWSQPVSGRGLEREDVVREVSPLFNRLTVFDPRVPHGVKRVEGVHDVLEGRLVIHGWFVQPRPFIEGPLAARDLQGMIDALSEVLGELFASGIRVQGTLSVRFRVDGARGKVSGVRVLTQALRAVSGEARETDAVLKTVQAFLARVSFGKQRGASFVTLPLIFE